jgi:predicted metal-dependent hydrolase
MDLSYTIVRSPKRKKLTITVERDRSVVVHAPEGASEEAIHNAVESRRQWLFDKVNHPQKYADLPHAPGKEVVNGESALYLGREYRIEIEETASGRVEFNRRFLVPALQQKRRREVLREWYFDRARETVLPRVKQCAEKLGVSYGTASVVDNRFRWGSCTVKDNLSFNWRLIKAPMFVIDYVIIHELAHLMEGNHTPRFWNIVGANCPLSEKAKTWLKEHGQLLEEEL